MNVMVAVLALATSLVIGAPSERQQHVHVFQSAPAASDSRDAPDMNAIVASIEEVQKTNAETMTAYHVTRQYRVFHEDDIEPVSTVQVSITFTPPASESYVIQQRSGNPRGEKIVRQILDQEVESAKDINHGQIQRPDYQFFFLRRDTFEGAAEYVLRIVPKRKRKTQLRGQIWVDANTFRIRRIEGMPSKDLSIFIKDVHITVQYADIRGSWLPVSFDAYARILLAGIYSISAHNLDQMQLPPTKH